MDDILAKAVENIRINLSPNEVEQYKQKYLKNFAHGSEKRIYIFGNLMAKKEMSVGISFLLLFYLIIPFL